MKARPRTIQPGKALEGSSAGRKPPAAASKRVARAKLDGSQTDPAVAAFLRELEHPLKREIEAVRTIILGVDPEIREAIKWNAPSFRTTEFFATFNLRSRERVQLVFHMGAKVRDTSTLEMQIADPAGLLEWRAKDRCLVTLGAGKDIQAKQAALEALVRAWIGQLRLLTPPSAPPSST